MSIATQLDAYLKEHESKKFECSAYNCCHFTCKWVELQEGVNPMDEFPADTLRAFRAARRAGWTLTDLWTKHMHRNPVPVSQLALGDVAMFLVRGNSQGAGIVSGRTAALITKTGMLYIPMIYALHGWKVGQ